MYTPKPESTALTVVRPPATRGAIEPIARDPAGRILPGQKLAGAGGRPKGLRRMMDVIIGEDGYRKCLETLVSIAYGELSKATPMHVRVQAISLIFDRRYGKPHVSVEVRGEDGVPAGNLGGLTPDQLRERRAALAAVLAETEGAP